MKPHLLVGVGVSPVSKLKTSVHADDRAFSSARFLNRWVGRVPDHSFAAGTIDKMIISIFQPHVKIRNNLHGRCWNGIWAISNLDRLGIRNMGNTTLHHHPLRLRSPDNTRSRLNIFPRLLSCIDLDSSRPSLRSRNKLDGGCDISRGKE